MGQVINHTGDRFGRLVAIGQSGRTKRGIVWQCRCDCGGVRHVAGSELRAGDTRSCGCLRHEHSVEHARSLNLRHGLTRTSAHRVWAGMRQRCNDPGCKDYRRYGGRGIKVCERWAAFENFLADMGDRPEGHSLDRIDNDGDYSPQNCRWATTTEQSRNNRGNRLVEIDGVSKCLIEWIEEIGISKGTVGGRLLRGWSVERALTTPADPRYNHGRYPTRGRPQGVV